VLNASVREGLGKYNEVPSIDFDTDDQISIPVLSQSHDIQIPSVPFNFDYNPFNSQGQSRSSSNTNNSFKQEVKGWESLYNDFESPRETDWSDTPETITLQSKGNDVSPIQEVPKLLHEAPISGNIYFQVKNRFILTPVKSGLMIIDQRRAHERILFEQFLSAITTNRAISQQLLFPETLEFSPADAMIISDISDDLKIFGIDLRENGYGSFMVQGLPCELENTNCRMILDRILDSYKSGEVNPEEEIREQLAAIMARNACMNHGETLSSEDMSTLVNRLFRCQMPNYTPSGKPVISIIENEELDGRFK
jgi:DNA mismatch repair protein MutL